ncbi:TonB-dependent receptor [Pseudomonas aeruginosa]|uniref:TonB-dependent receptor n=1 Tax=Pseudomonas aeruginosa TaxID=287 RepID=UPI000F132C10|nr:TonB-dependent receptor [Pseudomonas aeruginosa]VCW38399.1 Ferrichrome-iron receptor [Pseudomonas aeruginosa]VCX92273.1 Ferrichrome-iron receptor [Pseudomonas aeruginosa]VCZ00500.1 Ferrichrome-iron receptor [Pseudomonas aeruginosa]VDK99020.1 Ferrichrome-iron receptor [Pseudomonas aeruginosa]
MPRFSRLRTEPFALGLSTSLLLVPPALAETEEAALALPSQLVSVRQDPAELDHIDLATPVSAGSRLGLSALDTPASTSSISGEEVRRRNNPSVQAAVTRSPGISFIGTPGDGGTGLSARGFSGHASVMQLFDGTRLYTGMGTVNFPSDPWMVERIDVIRGPASVLYGEGATGAVINVVPKKPFAGEIRNHLRLGYGSYDNRQLALDSGGSLTDSLSYRLNLNQQQSHGWIDRGDSRNLGISAALRWQASDDLAFTLAHDYGDQEPMNDFGTPLVGGKYHKRLREKNYNVRNDVRRYNDQWTRLTSDWSLSDSVTASNQLYYIKARRHWRNAETYEWDVPREELLRRDYLRISHEQEQIGDRQTFAFQHALFGLDSRTLVGAEYNRIRFRLSNNSPYTDVGGDYIDPWHPAPGYFESRSPYRPHSRSQTRTFALFAENRLQLNERLSLVTGVRRDQNHIDRDDLRAGTRSDRSLQGGNWRAGMVFALTPELSLYGQYSTSEDGVSNLITLNAAQQQMDLTHSKQTEVGLKQLFPDGRGEWTLAAYHIVKKKLLSANPLPPHDAQQVGQQSSDGLEASLELNLAQDWRLSANAALVRAEYDDFDETIDGQTYSRNGNRPRNVPRRTANLWLDKSFAETLRVGAGLRYVDRRYADAANQASLPGYTVVDANLGWRVRPDLTLGLELYNLFDRQYALADNNNGQQWIMGQPRSFNVTADFSF